MKGVHPGRQPALAECQLTHLERVADRLPPRPPRSMRPTSRRWRTRASRSSACPSFADDPDAVFVEDTALMLGDHAVITRPGVASRADETESTADGLAAHFEVHRLDSGHLDGGDVLRIGRTLYVGLSTRTDARRDRRARPIVAPARLSRS